MPTILPSGESAYTTPEEILRYLNADGVRQLLLNERVRWNLKPNKDADYFSQSTNFRYTTDLHNEGDHARMETRTFPDNGGSNGYAGVHVDGGEFGMVHRHEMWDRGQSEESKKAIASRVEIGVTATREDKTGYGLESDGVVRPGSHNREASIVLDSYDGRAYLLSNDEAAYVNNAKRDPNFRIPERAIARMVDVPTNLTDLDNDLDFVSDWNYHHTDNNFIHSNRYVLDNLDDRTMVYPEISKGTDGMYISNTSMGLAGAINYAEGDGNPDEGHTVQNTQPDPENDRQGADASSYNKNKSFSGNNYSDGFFPGIFRSYEELLKVDILRQKKSNRNSSTPGGRRDTNYYNFDGRWFHDSYERSTYDESYLSESLNPQNMESNTQLEPRPFNTLNQMDPVFNTPDLYQWRYNRVSVFYHSANIVINVLNPGYNYRIGDRLRYTWADEVLEYEVSSITDDGAITSGFYVPEHPDMKFEQDPSSNGVGIPFSNYISAGRDATFVISCKASVITNATQIKNNLYAYVNVVPSVRSDNTTPWSDTVMTPTDDPNLVVRSTAPSPGFTGINRGRGGPEPSDNESNTIFYEHGGNATAGAHIHLFRYVINTANPTYEVVDGVKVYTGAWVDQGPISSLRPADIKALYLSNGNTNNFNNSYKFSLELLMDAYYREGDFNISGNDDAYSSVFLTIRAYDPPADKRFKSKRMDPLTFKIVETDITHKIAWLNAGTRVLYMFNPTVKMDPSYGYGTEGIGWIPIAGTITK